MEVGNLLIIDDDQDVLNAIHSQCSGLEADIILSSSIKKALKLFEKYQFDCVVVDIHVGGECGLEFAKKVKQEFGAIPIVFISGFMDEFTLKKAKLIGAFDIIEKPFAGEDLVYVLEDAIFEGMEYRKQAA
ncbi:MAG: response regulator [Bacteriovoracaceae bacterium]|jgi:FixJ family two-component response regulator|nr:response regulator [Bacteriovoracaceae bacterium]